MMHRHARAAARLMLCLILPLLVLALGALGASWAHAGGLAPPLQPEPRPVDICELPYALAPGERAVLLCHRERSTRRGPTVVASGHEAVDVSIVARVLPGRVVVALTNRSTEPVQAIALVETY